MAPACWLCGSVGGGFRKETVASACFSVWEKAVPQLLPWCQTLRLLPVCHWCLSSCYPDAGAQREWIWVSPCAGSLRGTVWDSSSSFHQLKPHWFIKPEVMWVYLSGTGTLGWGPGMWLGLLALKTSLLNIYPPHMYMGPVCSVSVLWLVIKQATFHFAGQRPTIQGSFIYIFNKCYLVAILL